MRRKKPPARVWVCFDALGVPTGVTRIASEAKDWRDDAVRMLTGETVVEYRKGDDKR